MKKFAFVLAVVATLSACHKPAAQSAVEADGDALALPGDATSTSLPSDITPAADSTATAD